MTTTPQPRRESPLWRYGLAILFAGLTVAIRWWLEPLIGPRHTYLGGNIAVALIAYRCGTGPAVVALLTIGFSLFRMFVAPTDEFRAGEPLGPLFVAMFSMATAGILIWLINELQRSRRDAQSQAQTAVTAEARVRERDTYLREFLDHTSAVVYLKDLDGRLLLVNRRDEALFPNVHDSPRGTSGDSSFPPESGATFSAGDTKVLDTGLSQTFEETVETPQGTRSYVTVKFPILDDHRRIIAVGGVSTNVSELNNARADVERKERILRNLIEIQEQEKQLLCGEFHDGLIQYAVGAKMMLESVPRDQLPPNCGEAVDAAINCLARGIEDGRRVIHGIRPAELDDLGLGAAIQTLIGDLEGAGVEVEATIEPMPDDTPPAFQVTVYRIVQEAFSNIRRHSGSRRARFSSRREGRKLLLHIEDFGNGGDRQRHDHQGFGITGMQERARLVGGECLVRFHPGEGTVVTVMLPIPQKDGERRGDPPAERRQEVGTNALGRSGATR